MQFAPDIETFCHGFAVVPPPEGDPTIPVSLHCTNEPVGAIFVILSEEWGYVVPLCVSHMELWGTHPITAVTPFVVDQPVLPTVPPMKQKRLPLWIRIVLRVANGKPAPKPQ